MAQVYRCERCGGIYDTKPELKDKDGTPCRIQIQVVLNPRTYYSNTVTIDLCKKCTLLLNDFVSNITVYSANSPGIELPEKKKKSWFGRRK